MGRDRRITEPAETHVKLKPPKLSADRSRCAMRVWQIGVGCSDSDVSAAAAEETAGKGKPSQRVCGTSSCSSGQSRQQSPPTSPSVRRAEVGRVGEEGGKDVVVEGPGHKVEERGCKRGGGEGRGHDCPSGGVVRTVTKDVQGGPSLTGSPKPRAARLGFVQAAEGGVSRDEGGGGIKGDGMVEPLSFSDQVMETHLSSFPSGNEAESGGDAMRAETPRRVPICVSHPLRETAAGSEEVNLMCQRAAGSEEANLVHQRSEALSQEANLWKGASNYTVEESSAGREGSTIDSSTGREGGWKQPCSDAQVLMGSPHDAPHVPSHPAALTADEQRVQVSRCASSHLLLFTPHHNTNAPHTSPYTRLRQALLLLLAVQTPYFAGLLLAAWLPSASTP